MKNLLIWWWMILVVSILCHSCLMSLSVIYIFTILMVLTHARGYIWSSIPGVMILCRVMTSSTHFLASMLWGDTRILNDSLCSRIYRIQYLHASCIQIGNCTPYRSTSYLCSIFHGLFVVTFLLMIKILASKSYMWIILEYTPRMRESDFRPMISAT